MNFHLSIFDTILDIVGNLSLRWYIFFLHDFQVKFTRNEFSERGR